MFSFITKKSIWVNLFFGLSLGLLIFGTFLFSLGWLTDHGKANAVPSLVGKSIDSAQIILTNAGFDWEVQDSVYVDSLPPLQVVKQIPEADEVVKSNRTILLIIRSIAPPLVEMPNLIGYSFRNAAVVLHTMDLKVGDTLFRPDFARNAVLEQRYQGAQIAAGTKIRKGSMITLVLGDGVGDHPIEVPALLGLTYSEAKALLDSNGLGLGAIVLDPGVKDTLTSFIYRQSPARLNEEHLPASIRPGQLIDIWLQSQRPSIDTAQ